MLCGSKVTEVGMGSWSCSVGELLSEHGGLSCSARYVVRLVMIPGYFLGDTGGCQTPTKIAFLCLVEVV